MTEPTLRIARSTKSISRLKPFYCDGLGFEILASFEDHAKFDGIMLGLPGAKYHLEFTVHHEALHVNPPDPEDLLVFYLPDTAEWSSSVQRMQSAGFTPVAPINPYWATAGQTFEDPDGHRIVLQNTSWPIETSENPSC